MDSDFQLYLKKARAVLEKNWMGDYTRPSSLLYPHQWSWDSGFIAIGYSTYESILQGMPKSIFPMQIFGTPAARKMPPKVFKHQESPSHLCMPLLCDAYMIERKTRVWQRNF
jgi:hypothetical protein